MLFVSILIPQCKEKPSRTETKIEYRTKTETVDRFIYRKLPGKIDTVFVLIDSVYVPNEIASIDTVLTSRNNKSKVYLNIRYDEFKNLFDIESNIVSVSDSIYIDKIVKETVFIKPKFLRPTVWLGSRFELETQEVKAIDLNAGFLLFDKYSTTIGIDNHKNVMLRFGVNF
jgi:hypothetical protein